jgi:hypothetical protein
MPLTFLVAFPSAGDATFADDDGESGAFIPYAFFLLLNGIAGDEQKLWISLLHGHFLGFGGHLNESFFLFP